EPSAEPAGAGTQSHGDRPGLPCLGGSPALVGAFLIHRPLISCPRSCRARGVAIPIPAAPRVSTQAAFCVSVRILGVWMCTWKGRLPVVFDEYEIVARGELSAREERAFRGMTLTQSGGKVVLSGRVRDQDDLEKLLRRVHGL